MKLLALMKKEFLRFFRDPKLIFTMIFPGVLIYAIYSIFGGVMWDKEKTTISARRLFLCRPRSKNCCRRRQTKAKG